MSDEKTRADSGVTSGPVLPSGSVSERPAPSSAIAEAAATGSDASTPVESQCKCGAGPHPTRAGRCANSHPLPGYGHELSWKTGEHSTRPPDTDGIDAHLATSSHPYRARLESDLWVQTLGLIRSLNRDLRERPRLARNPRTVQQLVALHQQARLIDAELRAAVPPPSVADVFTDVARIFAANADEFPDCMRQVLDAQPSLAAPLRAVLDAFDAQPQGEPAPDVPVMRVDAKPRPVFDEPDEVIL